MIIKEMLPLGYRVYLEGHGDLVSRLKIPINNKITPIIPMINLLIWFMGIINPLCYRVIRFMVIGL